MNNIENFKEEITSVWSFPERGNWGPHSGTYRGNFAPQVARNVILKYSRKKDLILDPMCGGGTSLIEAKLLKRRSLGFDINPKAVRETKEKLNYIDNKSKCLHKVNIGDVRDLNNIENNSIDLIITHPPYLDIIKYSKGKIKGDFSNFSNIKDFIKDFSKGIKELFRVLKENSYCAILIGDTRKGGHYVPLSNYVMIKFLEHGFVLKEDIIKIQHNCKSNSYWRKKVKQYNFHLIMHEHLFIFRKPEFNENLSRIQDSVFMI
ncbi:MAG: TRM11 family SAM-dependent methyltransferase [Candidatus Woesearchaeota archaeon]